MPGHGLTRARTMGPIADRTRDVLGAYATAGVGAPNESPRTSLF